MKNQQITEEPLVKEEVLVKGYKMKEKDFDQVRSLNHESAGGADALVEWIATCGIAWIQFYPKGSTYRSHWILMEKEGKLFKTAMFSQMEWEAAQLSYPQVYIK